LRIIAPIPGRSVVGFEVANITRQTVHFAELINHQLYTTSSALLPLAVGQDTQGNVMVIDLATAPHLLVAGTTGSGKSVALQTMLMSLLYKYSPDDLTLLLIDPKRLEFATYADCAHLLLPIITDPHMAVAALRFAVRTMQERYEELAKEGVRTIAEYRLRRGNSAMPFMVIIIDELADLMMTAGKEIEALLIRLAQMSRAAGIHIIVATQRPSVDVITGIIKANFPARLALKVASKIDSRTIIDTAGAERLLGKGDMLFLDGTGTLRRLHGAYVTDQEITKVTDHIRLQRRPNYQDLGSTLHDAVELHEEDDMLYQQVRAFLNEVEEVSISLLQRKFRIGYNRSARIIDLLQAQGLIASAEAGAKTRRVIRN
jgi:S-DNA-T family DNA segregation ATPase FtsK/SpoIIIE